MLTSTSILLQRKVIKDNCASAQKCYYKSNFGFNLSLSPAISSGQPTYMVNDMQLFICTLTNSNCCELLGICSNIIEGSTLEQIEDLTNPHKKDQDQKIQVDQISENFKNNKITASTIPVTFKTEVSLMRFNQTVIEILIRNNFISEDNSLDTINLKETQGKSITYNDCLIKS